MPSLTWCLHFACLKTLKLCLGQNSTKPNICIWGFTGIVVRCFRPHLTLPRLDSFIMLHPLAMFNQHLILLGYMNEGELNN